MKIKIVIIAVLLLVIISSAGTSTWSAFSTGFNNNADISPDIERIESMYYEEPGGGNKKLSLT